MKKSKVNNKVFSNMLSHDVSFGISNKTNWFIVSQLFFLIISIYSYSKLCVGIPKGEKVGFVDLFLTNFYGMIEYTKEQKEAFVVPFIILGMFLIIAFIVNTHIESEFQVFGQNILIRGGSKANWWNSKCITAVCQVLVYFIQYIVTNFIIMIVINRKIVWGGKVSAKLYGFNLEKSINIVLFMLMIVCVIIAFSIMQLFITIRFDAVIAIIVTTVVIVASCYYYKAYFLVNHVMSARTGLFLKGGVDPIVGFIEAAVIILVFYILGRVYINKKDWLRR